MLTCFNPPLCVPSWQLHSQPPVAATSGGQREQAKHSQNYNTLTTRLKILNLFLDILSRPTSDTNQVGFLLATRPCRLVGWLVAERVGGKEIESKAHSAQLS